MAAKSAPASPAPAPAPRSLEAPHRVAAPEHTAAPEPREAPEVASAPVALEPTVASPVDVASDLLSAQPSVGALPHADRTVTHAAGEPTPRLDLHHAATGRLRDAATASADLHAIRRSVDARVDLGEAGHIAVVAREPHGAIDVRVDADSRETAGILARNAPELVNELARSAPDVRVTIGSSTTSQTFGNGSGSRPHDREPRQEPETSRGVEIPEPPRGPHRRVRIVL